MSVIDEYLNEHATKTQLPVLQHIRALMKEIVPETIEVISYGIPTFKYRDKNLIHFAAFKNHMSLFPTASPIAEIKKKLEPFATAKGTIQFTEDNLVPDRLLREIIELRISDIDGR